MQSRASTVLDRYDFLWDHSTTLEFKLEESGDFFSDPAQTFGFDT